MKVHHILQELETLAERLSVEVRYDDLEGRGGLCRYGGKWHLIISRSLSAEERIEVLARELVRFPLDNVFVLPRIRAIIEAHDAGVFVIPAPSEN